MHERIEVLQYNLPPEKIALFPVDPRDSSKLLVYQQGKITHSVFTQLAEILNQNHLLIFNNSKVVNARLHMYTDAGNLIEIFCLEPAQGRDPALALNDKNKSHWHCLIGGAKKWKSGVLEAVYLRNNHEEKFTAQLISKDDGNFLVQFNWDNSEIVFSDILDVAGELPLPPYLNRKAIEKDQSSYQTVYAEKNGSVAAPTAGLHFTDAMLQKLLDKGIEKATVTLHVGAGTFRPIKHENAALHDMHSELIEVSATSLTAMLNHKKNIIAVGTTSLRTMETCYWMGVKAFSNPNATLHELAIKQWDAYLLDGTLPREKALNALLQWMQLNQQKKIICSTKIMIAPGYKSRVAHGIITNFHQPGSTLLLLIAAVVGDDWKKIYEAALANDYRFLSYGDSSLLFFN